MADTDSSSDSKVSSAQLRKIKKPIIEKRRRERINESLNQVKTLVLDALNKDESRFSKMEKADILEMTVQHLRAVQRREQRAPGGVGGPGGPGGPVSAASRYRAGFTECAHEVRRYLAAAEGVSATVHERLVSHLEAIARRNNVLNGAVTEGLEAEGVKIEPVPSPVTTNHVSRSSSSNPSSVSLSSPSSVSNVSMNSGVMSVSTAPGNTTTVATRAALPLNACVAVSANSSPATMTTTAMTQLPIRVATAGNVGGVLGQSSHVQHPQYTTLTINGTTARILLAPGPVTFIAPPQAQPQALPQASAGLHPLHPAPAQTNVASDLRPGTAIPLYIHTHHLPSQHLPSPGASDGESGGSVSPVSMSSSTSNTSNTSNASSSQHWPHADQHPTETQSPHSIAQHAVDNSIEQSMEQSQRPFPIKIQPESVYDPVWRPW